jgi:hypothetical protein
LNKPRLALVESTDPEEVRKYLPQNYEILPMEDYSNGFLIVGKDVAAWTLDDYVIPRLASGLIHCREVTWVLWECLMKWSSVAILMRMMERGDPLKNALASWMTSTDEAKRGD